MTAASTHGEDRSARLRRLDLAEEEARVVEHLWNWPALQLLADERILFLANYGYSALDTLDAVWHGLEGVVGHTYLQHGLTPHQGFLIHNSPTASLNMWGPDRDIDRVHRLLGASLPADVIAGILLTADSPTEAAVLINCYASTEHDDSPEYEIAMLRVDAVLRSDEYRSVVGCDCLGREGGEPVKP